MKHTFTYKLLDKIDNDLLVELKKYVLNEPLFTSNDFQGYTLQISKSSTVNPAVQEMLRRNMAKFFKLEGHIETNIAKMFPGGYVPEHSDYTANTYGSAQDSIVKFQIPIITNPGAGLMWKWDVARKLPAEALFLEEGGIYAFDNCRVHSSVNLGSTDRYWLTSRWRVESLIDKSVLE